MSAQDRAAAKLLLEITRAACEIAIGNKDGALLVELATAIRWPPAETQTARDD